MSRHPSPGSSHTPQSLHQPPTLRVKSKSHPIGIAAGAEDVKYQAKYKELKRKVKEIEADNDKLHFKVLQAKRSIQRMKLERAVLYERLSVVPPSPELHDRHPLPPMHQGHLIPPPLQSTSHSQIGNPPHRELREHPSHESDHSLLEYVRTYGPSRAMPSLDGRSLPGLDTPMGPGVAPQSHGLSALHMSRRGSASSAHDSSRQLPPLPQLPPVQHFETSRGHDQPHPHLSHSGSSHERSRSSSRSRLHQGSGQVYHPNHPYQQQYQESLPPVQHVLLSPSLSERERSRRHDVHELAGSRDSRSRGLAQASPLVHPSEARGPVRIHNHQRMGPGTYINRDDHHERDLERDRDRERDWENNRGRDRDLGVMHSPTSTHRPRHQERRDYQEHHVGARPRDESTYHHDMPGGYSMLSRSGTPGSGSGSGSGTGAVEGPSRPDSRTQGYDHERPRSYRLRPVNQPNEEADFVHEDGQSQSRDRGGSGGGALSPEQSRSSLDTRKRSRNDMEVDLENDTGEGAPGGFTYAGGHVPDDRGRKRFHQESASRSRRSIDRQEDRDWTEGQ